MGRRPAAVYPTGSPRSYTYYQRSPHVTGTLQQSVCGWNGCRTRTPLFPFCAKHAHTVLGIVLRKNQFGGGLYAARSFQEGDVIVPYTGKIVGPDCKSTPYLINTSNVKLVIDATLHRCWAAMINHSGSTANVRAECLRIPRRAAGGKTGHYRRRIALSHNNVRNIPLGLLRDPFLDQVCWPFLVATRSILSGEELLLNYGTDAAHLVRLQHQTTPPLCV
jgi:hypothetical protein